jgi:hypothetical protein
MSALYVYNDEHGIDTKFEISHVRDRKAAGKQWQIPCHYNEETREVETIEEIEEKRHKQDEVDKEIALSKKNKVDQDIPGESGVI